MEQARSITFVIPGASGSPGVQIKAVEALGGKLDMTVNVLQSSTLTADLRGLFFNVADDLKLAGLGFTQSQNTITDFDTVDVIQLKNGANMNGAANPFDVGFEFGTAGRAKDDIKSASFTLDNAAHNLNLDDIAHMNFGVRLTSIGSPADLDAPLSTAATEAYEDAREKVRAFLNAPAADQIIFTAGGTDSINLVANALGASIAPGDEIVLSEMEHHSNIVPWHFLRERRGAVIRWVPIKDDGALDLEAFERLLSSETKLVALTHMSNVLGTVTPAKDITPRSRPRRTSAV